MATRILSLLTLLFFFTFYACNEDNAGDAGSKSVTVTGIIEDTIRQPVSLWEVRVIGRDAEISIDSSSTESFTVTTEIDQPGHYRLRYGRGTVNLFLHPGDELTVEASAEDLRGTVLFTGHGSDVNNYIADAYRKVDAYNADQEEQNAYKLEESEFIERVDGQRDMLNEMYEQRFGQGAPSPSFEYFAKAEIMGDWANSVSNYPDYHGYYTGIEDFEVSEEYETILVKAPLDDSNAMIAPNYRSFLSARAQRGMNEMVSEDESLSEDWPKAFQMYYTRLANDSAMGSEAREYILASHLYDYISYFGVDGVDEIYADFNSKYPDSEYAPEIKDKYDSWSKLAKGKPAPVFEYASIDGAQVGLDDFTGNVVYVDVWATWCGPCKREIPSSKELKKKFEGEDVVFMYVSVDDNQESWEKYLEDDPEFKGVHLITGTGWKSDITDDYMISGIPRYVLVDRNGNIVSASAPRPSSGDKIESMIRGALDSGQEPAGD